MKNEVKSKKQIKKKMIVYVDVIQIYTDALYAFASFATDFWILESAYLPLMSK